MWRGVGIGVKVAWGVEGSGGVPSAYSLRQLLEVRRAPLPLYPGERIPVNVERAFSFSHFGVWDCRRSQSATRGGKGCHRNTCSRGCAGVSFCPTSVAVRVMAAQYWCLHSDTCGTVTVPPLQFLLCTEPERFVADCWCAFVMFSSVPGRSQGSPLNMLLGFAQYR